MPPRKKKADPLVAACAAAPAPKKARAKQGSRRCGTAAGASVAAVADEVPAIPVEKVPASNDTDSQATLCFGDAVVQHDIVVNDGIRAKNNTRRCKQVLPISHFHDLANEAAANFGQVLMNACIQYQPPLLGDVECAFEGKVDQEGDEIITAGDVVAFRWSYKCAVGNGIMIDGSCKTEHNTRHMKGNPPSLSRSTMGAAQIAKLYDFSTR